MNLKSIGVTLNITEEEYLKILNNDFRKHLKNSLSPSFQVPNDYKSCLLQTYEDISNNSYLPSSPVAYIVIDKHNGVSRYVPVLTYEDYCVYYFCVKVLEGEIAENRVVGTYGGWTMGGAIREAENENLLQLHTSSEGYYPPNAFNRNQWIKEWSSFQNLVKAYMQYDEFSYFVKMDIANFYDSINLSILKEKLTAQSKNKEIINTLMLFLSRWNYSIEGGLDKSVGIPQDEVGEMSRLLANFYLQSYDAIMKKECKDRGAEYMRYADDLIIFAKSKKDAKEILFAASRELLVLSLNLNSGKVKEFCNKDDFDKYWGFEIFDFLQNEDNSLSINQGVESYFRCIDMKLDFRKDSVLRKILSVDKSLLLKKKSKESVICNM